MGFSNPGISCTSGWYNVTSATKYPSTRYTNTSWQSYYSWRCLPPNANSLRIRIRGGIDTKNAPDVYTSWILRGTSY